MAQPACQATLLGALSRSPRRDAEPEYHAASQPRFDRWIIDDCTRPFDQVWLDYQQEMGLRHTRAKKNQTDHADSVDHTPMRYLLAFTAIVINSARDYPAVGEHSAQHVHEMHAAFTKAVMLRCQRWR